jgi:serine/threonine protein kinase
MLSGNPYDPVKIDTWNLGIILYAMCFGMLPFDH